MSDVRTLWQERLPDELAFWDAWLASRGSCYGCDPDEFRARFDPTTPLQENLRALIDAPEGATVRILDVGAGPATVIGWRWQGRNVGIVAIDPLAEEYNRLLDKHRLIPPVRTAFGPGEELHNLAYDWKAMLNRFDLAYARNSLDHSYDPLTAVTNMYAAVKPGGVVYLLHHDNEATRRGCQGLHQWDFYREGDAYTMRRPGESWTGRFTFPDMTMRAIGDQTEVIIRKPLE